jgi:hypothetical protein
MSSSEGTLLNSNLFLLLGKMSNFMALLILASCLIANVLATLFMSSLRTFTTLVYMKEVLVWNFVMCGYHNDLIYLLNMLEHLLV